MFGSFCAFKQKVEKLIAILIMRYGSMCSGGCLFRCAGLEMLRNTLSSTSRVSFLSPYVLCISINLSDWLDDWTGAG